MAKKGFTQDTESFISNPTMGFISKESVEAVEGKEAPVAQASKVRPPKAPEGYKLNPEFIETKSKRVQILIQPSVHDAIKEKAKAMGISTNEAINEALRQYVGL